jgi:FkbM family methyltransferase
VIPDVAGRREETGRPVGAQAKSKLGRFLAKSNRGKYAALARLAMGTLRVPAVPVRLPFGAWWLAGRGTLDERLLNGKFETSELRFVESYLQPGMTVLDIGAHHGLYSLLAAQRVGKNGRVRSFEPSPRECKFFRQNLRINRCRNVQIENFALGSGPGRAELFLVEGAEDVCNSLRPPAAEVKTTKVSVEVRPLDEYLEERKIEKVDFIKLDVEGAELEVLRGAKRLLSSASRPVILAEVQDIRTASWGYRAAEIIRYLEEFGFCWYSLSESGDLIALDTKAIEYDGNFVACPEGLLSRGERVQ